MRRLIAVAAAGLFVLLALDLRRAPADQWSSALALAGIDLYQATLSPLYARMGVACRFTPTCSRYGEQAIRQLGVARGGWLAAKRIVRCGPWTPLGTYDPAPDQGSGIRRQGSGREDSGAGGTVPFTGHTAPDPLR